MFKDISQFYIKIALFYGYLVPDSLVFFSNLNNGLAVSTLRHGNLYFPRSALIESPASCRLSRGRKGHGGRDTLGHHRTGAPVIPTAGDGSGGISILIKLSLELGVLVVGISRGNQQGSTFLETVAFLARQ